MTEFEAREAIYKKIWSIADALRHKVDGWDFKEYVLICLFYKYISEKLRDDINENERKSDPNFNYSDLSDEGVPEEMQNDLVREKGYCILPSDLFENVLKVCRNNHQEAQERLRVAFENISNSARGSKNHVNFAQLFSIVQLNSEKLGATLDEKNKSIVELLEGINNMKQVLVGEKIPLDNLGHAYEFLIRMYAAGAGKSGGEFFTPPEVSELLAKLALNNRTKIEKAYDPACGSGSLLLKLLSSVKEKDKKGEIRKICGQEVNFTSHKLAIMNMFLSGLNYNKLDIAFGDTILSEAKKEHCEADAIVSNPPYSAKWTGPLVPEIIKDPRYSVAGALAPKKASDLAFVMHSLYCLKELGGVAAIVLFPGVFYRGGAEQKIRKYLIDNNFVDTIISLADKLFYGTSISTYILVLKKGRADTNVLFIDASKEFEKVKAKNRLSPENIKKILDTYFGKKEIPLFSRLVSYEEIKENDYNLAINKYVFQENLEEEINIEEVNREIEDSEGEITRLKQELNQVIREIEEYLGSER